MVNAALASCRVANDLARAIACVDCLPDKRDQGEASHTLIKRVDCIGYGHA